ncbi:MAG: aspartyl-phosphate phosphatase Spo0E family protein [Bacillota bacterium]|nr:aspartyl-phosphate phosphatase Spo0E family protein [Bacillota bacterium]
MEEIDVLRKRLYDALETQDKDAIIHASRELDAIILKYMKPSIDENPSHLNSYPKE